MKVVDITAKTNDTVVPFHFVDGDAAIAIAVKHRILTIKGEIDVDANYGVAWFNEDGFILTEQYIPELTADIHAQIDQVDGVETVDLVTVTKENMQWNIEYRINGGSQGDTVTVGVV